MSAPSRKRSIGSRARTRTSETDQQPQSLANQHSQPDSQGVFESLDGDLKYIIQTWAKLSPALKAGVMGIVRSVL